MILISKIKREWDNELLISPYSKIFKNPNFYQVGIYDGSNLVQKLYTGLKLKTAYMHNL